MKKIGLMTGGFLIFLSMTACGTGEQITSNNIPAETSQSGSGVEHSRQTSEESETETETGDSYGATIEDLRLLAASNGDLCAAVFLGYGTDIATFLAEADLSDYPFLWEIPEQNYVEQPDGGNEIYCIIPTDQSASLAVNEWIMDESNGFYGEPGQVLYRSEAGGPILLCANPSDVVPGTQVTIVDSAGEVLDWNPSLSLYDGTMNIPWYSPGVTDLTDYNSGSFAGQQSATLPESSDGDTLYADAETEYMNFLDGAATAVVISDEDVILEEGEYTLGEISDRCSAFLGEMDMPDVLKSTTYSLIDCGLDGEPELAVCMEFTTSDEYDFAREYLFFKWIDGRIQYLAGCNSYYRREVWLNSAGMIDTSTMFDYYNSKQTESLIDAKGRISLVYSVQYAMGLEANLIPENYLPADVREELEIRYSSPGDSQETYMLAIYNFMEPPTGDDEDAYNEYLRRNWYVFSDEAGNPAMPEDEILGLYREKGILIYEEDEMNAILEEHKRELGITWEIENAPEIQWTEVL